MLNFKSNFEPKESSGVLYHKTVFWYISTDWDNIRSYILDAFQLSANNENL